VLAVFSRFEPLFKLLTLGCYKAGTGFHGYLAVTALISILPSVYVIEKRSGNTPLGLFVYGAEWMYYGCFVILRQGLATGLAFLAFDALLDKRYRRFFVSAILAAGFHYSAAVLLVASLFRKELRPRYRTALLAAAGVVFWGFEAISALGLYDAFRIGGVGTQVLAYFVDGKREPINPLNAVEIVGFAFLIFRYAGKAPALLRNAYLLYACVIVAALQHAILDRFGWYYEIAFALLVPFIVDPDEDRPRERTLAGILLVGYFLAKNVRWLLINGGGIGGFLPYRTFL
jgi:transmembrane protein EpsG